MSDLLVRELSVTVVRWCCFISVSSSEICSHLLKLFVFHIIHAAVCDCRRVRRYLSIAIEQVASSFARVVVVPAMADLFLAFVATDADASLCETFIALEDTMEENGSFCVTTPSADSPFGWEQQIKGPLDYFEDVDA